MIIFNGFIVIIIQSFLESPESPRVIDAVPGKIDAIDVYGIVPSGNQIIIGFEDQFVSLPERYTFDVPYGDNTCPGKERFRENDPDRLGHVHIRSHRTKG